MIRVVVADDQELVRSGFAMILESDAQIEVVGEAADGARAVAVCAAVRPDVALVDVRMPEMDGIEATRRIVAQPEGTRVLMLTTFDLDEYVYSAIRAGASGFLLKDVHRDDLPHAVRTIARGETVLAPAVTRRLVEQFVQRPPPGAQPEELAELTSRELEIFLAIARGRSNAEIAADLFLSEHTVKTHVTRVLQKMGLRDRIQAIVYAYENGLVQPGQSD